MLPDNHLANYLLQVVKITEHPHGEGWVWGPLSQGTDDNIDELDEWAKVVTADKPSHYYFITDIPPDTYHSDGYRAAVDKAARHFDEIVKKLNHEMGL